MLIGIIVLGCPLGPFVPMDLFELLNWQWLWRMFAVSSRTSSIKTSLACLNRSEVKHAQEDRTCQMLSSLYLSLPEMRMCYGCAFLALFPLFRIHTRLREMSVPLLLFSCHCFVSMYNYDRFQYMSSATQTTPTSILLPLRMCELHWKNCDTETDLMSFLAVLCFGTYPLESI